ncbi:MAG: glutathione S-transferase family protein [Alphaproteobacteria bacterium]|nr:glutathione S-transferase family protein [Alphaproteobacteria bacterium]
MHKLTHYRLCPLSRSIRVVLDELELKVNALEEQPWDLGLSFLQLNPAGELPVLEIEAGPVLCGTYAICEYIAEELKRHPHDGLVVPLFPGNREERAEVRRLVDWFHGKLHREVTRELLYEKVYARLQPGNGGHAPDADILRAVRANLRYHLSYIGFLAHGRRWLAGEDLSFADIAAAAQLSTIDYFDEVPWDEYPQAKEWYARIKSRPAFRSILADRIPGSPPPRHYTNLDF